MVNNNYQRNASGRFYVDKSCIDCKLCLITAPDNFKRKSTKTIVLSGNRISAEGHSYVFHQPSTKRQLSDCLKAFKDCPVEAIKDSNR